MKKKIVAMCATVAIAALAVGGTLAYFTDTDEAENVFTFGNVNIEQVEQQRGADGAIEDFEQNKNIMPANLGKLAKSDITVDGYTFGIRSLEGNYVYNIVNVENTGTEEAYVRTVIAIPSMNGYDDDEDATENPLHWNYLDATDFGGTGWDWNGSSDAEATQQLDNVAAVTIDGVEYDIYVATYNKALAADAITSPSMVGFYLDDSVNCDEDGYFTEIDGQRVSLAEWMKAGDDGKVTMKILVATQACQTEGFADAWTALDAAFGDITKTNHPWA